MPVASSDALTGFGLPPELSALIGGNANLQAGTGTTQTGATILHSKNTELNPQASATAFTFASTVGIMEPYWVNNQQSTTALVYVPSGHYLNSVQNASVSVAQYGSALIWMYKRTGSAGYWAYK
jgi:hypothetical protein